MAILIIEQPGRQEFGTLMGRVLIGRWPDNTVVIDDKAVSRIHAWVGVQDGQFYIADAGSRTGTLVNGQPLRERHVLVDGDEIGIGPAAIRYVQNSAFPIDLAEIDLSPRTPEELSGKQGVFMDCVCGAPLWLPSNFAGVGQCRYCGHTVTQTPKSAPRRPARRFEVATAAVYRPMAETLEPRIPVETSAVKNGGNDDDEFEAAMNESFTKSKPASAPYRRVPPPAPLARPTARQPGPVVPSVTPAKPAVPFAAPSIKQLTPAAPLQKTNGSGVKAERDPVCGICHAPITVFDEVTGCPSCGLGFHVDCWQENHGCSAYGCSQVGAVGKHG